MKHALIVGASSISGYPLAKKLLLCGDWQVTGIERRPHLHTRKKYNVINADLSDLSDLKQKLPHHVQTVTHVFYTAWKTIPGGSPEEEARVNHAMFSNLLNVLTTAAPSLVHVYLQTGTMYYGMQFGPKAGYVSPAREEDERLSKPIFYYPQEDTLKKHCARMGWTFSVARPPWIIGYTTGTSVNIGTSLAIYATVLKELGQPLIYPFSQKSYRCLRELADNNLVTNFIMWMINPENYHAHDEVFNINNGDCYRMEQLWPIIAQYFGMDVAIAEEGTRINLSDFMKDKKDVWRDIVRKHNLLDIDLNTLGTWAPLQLFLEREWDEITLCNKAYNFGFNQRTDTAKALYDFFDSLQNRGVIPKTRRKVELPYITRTASPRRVPLNK